MRDRVTTEVAEYVARRDGSCRAPYLGGTSMDCWGTDGYEHVKSEPRMARRAPSCPCGLVLLCEGHREPGMRAGYIWCTDRTNRNACRDYLTAFGYGPHTDDHVATILAPVIA